MYLFPKILRYLQSIGLFCGLKQVGVPTPVLSGGEKPDGSSAKVSPTIKDSRLALGIQGILEWGTRNRSTLPTSVNSAKGAVRSGLALVELQLVYWETQCADSD
jgi:hypothetical protein